jgi:hypothetical protein
MLFLLPPNQKLICVHVPKVLIQFSIGSIASPLATLFVSLMPPQILPPEVVV